MTDVVDHPDVPKARLLLIASTRAAPRYWQGASESFWARKLQEGSLLCPWLFPGGAETLDDNPHFQNSDVLAVCVVQSGRAYTGPLT